MQMQLSTKSYRHGGYKHFTVHDSKKREIAVAAVYDRVIHRLLYDYLLPKWNESFIFDAWSCRPGKGLHAAVARAHKYMALYPRAWVWRADITKFFDTIDQAVLLEALKRKVESPDALWLIESVLSSYYKNEVGRGMPIGNLTSQIFANIYLNEFDRFMVHVLKPVAYLRYGDDWLCFANSKDEVEAIRQKAIIFLAETLKLKVNPKLNHVQPAYKGVTFLGVDIWSNGLRITSQTQARIRLKINNRNYASYEALVRQFSNEHGIKKFYWQTLDI